MRQWLFWTCMLLLVGGLACAAVELTGASGRPPLRAQVRVTDILGQGPTLGFATADAPVAMQFPRDHGPHPAFRSEWWYLTGNLTAADGRRFGYQLTIFRSALKPPVAALLQTRGPSAWHTDQLYMAQFAFTDVAGNCFTCSDRFGRGGVGLAGAAAEPFRVWLDDWSIAAASVADEDPPAIPAGALPPLELHATQPSASGDIVLDLRLVSQKPPTLQGDRGLSRKSDGPGQASYYFSLTRLTTSGALTIGGERFTVTGLSWLDREWSTSSLAPNQVGWDWFAIHLHDGRDLMYYQLRQTGGKIDPHSAGSITAADGAVTPLTAADVVLTPTATWHSARTGGDYPAQWRLQIPGQQIDLLLQPLIPDQELNLYVQYWEGACSVHAMPPAGPTALSLAAPSVGDAYVELTGYATPPAAPGSAAPVAH